MVLASSSMNGTLSSVCSSCLVLRSMVTPCCTRVILFTGAGMAERLRMVYLDAMGFLYHFQSTVLSAAIRTSRSRIGIQPEGWLEGKSISIWR